MVVATAQKRKTHIPISIQQCSKSIHHACYKSCQQPQQIHQQLAQNIRHVKTTLIKKPCIFLEITQKNNYVASVPLLMEVVITNLLMIKVSRYCI
jgi:hypothetical protein